MQGSNWCKAQNIEEHRENKADTRVHAADGNEATMYDHTSGVREQSQWRWPQRMGKHREKDGKHGLEKGASGAWLDG